MIEIYDRVIAAFGAFSMAGRFALLALITLVTSAVGLAIIVCLPPNYFLHQGDPTGGFHRRTPTLWLVFAARNLLGLLFLPLGIVMSIPLVPGPGVVFILIAVSLLEFPGKRALERKLLVRQSVIGVLNNIRSWFHRPPLLTGGDS